MVARPSLFALAAVACSARHPAPAPEPPTCTVRADAPAGPICGLRYEAGGEPVQAFLGIPYTARVERWRPASPHPTFDAPIQATRFGPSCPQTVDPGSAGQDEQCLSLNVWRPQGAGPDSALPVLVYLHGGAFTQGGTGLNNRGATGPTTDWDSYTYSGGWIAPRHDVIVVSANYRFGALGFLRYGNIQGNLGITDQTLALQWVLDNISAFGGDPDQVTLWGESVGGKSVAFHLASVAAWQPEPPFAGGIVQSNSFPNGFLTVEDADQVGAWFAQELECDSEACLRQASVQEVLDAQTAVLAKMNADSADRITADMPFAPVVDGQVVTSDPLTAFLEGGVHAPVLMGTTADEGTFFTYGSVTDPLSAQDYLAKLTGTFGAPTTEQITALDRYACTSDDCRPQLATVLADYTFVCATRLAARTAGSPAFVYAFEQRSPSFSFTPTLPICDDQVCHTADLPYVFHTPDSTWTPGDPSTPWSGGFSTQEAALSQEMIATWTQFAATRDPGWPAHGESWRVFGGDQPVAQEDQSHCTDLWDPILSPDAAP